MPPTLNQTLYSDFRPLLKIMLKKSFVRAVSRFMAAITHRRLASEIHQILARLNSEACARAELTRHAIADPACSRILCSCGRCGEGVGLG